MSPSADLEYAIALADEADILSMRHYRSLDLRVEPYVDVHRTVFVTVLLVPEPG